MYQPMTMTWAKPIPWAKISAMGPSMCCVPEAPSQSGPRAGLVCCLPYRAHIMCPGALAPSL